jgi:hypothetical protein
VRRFLLVATLAAAGHAVVRDVVIRRTADETADD